MAEYREQQSAVIDEPLDLIIDMASKVSLAMHHNSVPFLKKIVIRNNSEAAIENIELKLLTEPGFIKPKTWHLTALGPGQSQIISNQDFGLDPAMLDALTEAQPAKASFSVSTTGRDIIKEVPIELLARNQWGGAGYFPQLLCSFIQPNDGAIEKILRVASENLRASGHDDSLNGYTVGSKERVWQLASAIWNSIVSMNLSYALPPVSFEVSGQKIRLPKQIYENRLATCLDLTVLFAAALEHCGLHPLVVLVKDHAFPGLWLKEQSAHTVLIDDITMLRNRVKLGEILLFEATMATHKSPKPSLRQAMAKAAEHISEKEEDKFEFAIDVKVARSQGIRPLSDMVFERNTSADTDDAGAVDIAPLVEAAPDFADVIESATEAPLTPQTRLEHWQRKLLDLSLRNSLLNFRAVKRSIAFIAPDPGKLEDILAAGVEFKLMSSPALMQGSDPRDAELHQVKYNEDAAKTNALAALDRNEIHVPLKDTELDTRLTELYRTARTDMEEGGSNTLHLALGFLSWRQDKAEDKKLKAPLILIPVKLLRKSVKSGYKLVLHEDEPKFNPTLLEMLRKDFHLAIPEVEGELPKDHSGLDIKKIWQAVITAVKDIRGWELTEDVVLSTFSFSKFLMWKDLVERTEQLKLSPIVKHLIETPREPFMASDGEFPEDRSLDKDFAPENVFCPLPSDASQLRAVLAASSGKNFVLEGPPGTGKSQTIANMISHCLASGKTVLFVSEKIAALNVVHRRLKEQGLAEFCLELHSAKARKAEVLESLKRSWASNGKMSHVEWEKSCNRLKSLRNELNSFVTSLHKTYGNGLTAYSAIGIDVSNGDIPDIGLAWSQVNSHSQSDMDDMRQLAQRLGLNALETIAQGAEINFALLESAEWSTLWQERLVSNGRSIIPVAQEIDVAASQFCRSVGMDTPVLTLAIRNGLAELARVLPKAAGYDWRFVMSPSISRMAQRFGKGVAISKEHKDVQASLSTIYKPEALQLDLDALHQSWVESDTQWFLKKGLTQAKIRKKLRTVMSDPRAKPSFATDIPKLIELKRLTTEIDTYKDLTEATHGLWQGLQTDFPQLLAALSFNSELQPALAKVASDMDAVTRWRAAIERALGDGNPLLSSGATISNAATNLLSAATKYEAAEAAFLDAAGSNQQKLSALALDTPSKFSGYCEKMLTLQPRIRAWCAWQKVRQEASNVGLAPLVEALEQKKISPNDCERAFQTAYCRWWIKNIIDGNEALRCFVATEHEKKISDFRILDDKLSRLTTEYIRAKLHSDMPSQASVQRNSEWGILRHEMEKKKAHIPLRQLISRLPTAMTKLVPCLLMSPLSVAQYLPPDTSLFDVVIFDEASQIPVWDAIGAIARGKQCVIVGDPKQLPPTSFFDRKDSAAVDDEVIEVEDLESILDECLGASIPKQSLDWHYRSRHESLIAFSNHNYYDGRLVTFPSPVTDDRAVSLNYIPEAVYEKGGARTNKAEAKALVADIVAMLKSPVYQSGKTDYPTIGVVTLNSEQQKLIEDLLDDERRKSPEIEPFFAEELNEGIFVKNLESVQGDERDIIYFSVTYGPDVSKYVSMNFGPINKPGGKRRLNVAITRARQGLKVFSSIKAEHIDLSRSKAEGVRDLKWFLDFSDRGAQALGEVIKGVGGYHESPFEVAVAEALSRKGWQVHAQIGVSAFRIDLAVVDPDMPGRYLSGVECDGATYHRSATARDRDKLREQVLRGLGWEILRIWSTDWWVDPQTVLDKVDTKLRQLLEDRRKLAA